MALGNGKQKNKMVLKKLLQCPVITEQVVKWFQLQLLERHWNKLSNYM